MINLRHRQPHLHSPREIGPLSAIGLFVGAEMEMARLEEKSSQLSDRLESRKVVERAKGILQRELQMSEQEPYLNLRRQSRQLRKTMKEVAQSIIREDTERTPKRSLTERSAGFGNRFIDCPSPTVSPSVSLRKSGRYGRP